MKVLEKMLETCDLISNGDSFEAEKWVFENFESLKNDSMPDLFRFYKGLFQIYYNQGMVMEALEII